MRRRPVQVAWCTVKDGGSGPSRDHETGSCMRIGFIEPHMKRFGGIRRVIELGNHLAARGHQITYYVHPEEEAVCGWMRCAGDIVNLRPTNPDHLDLLIYNNEPDWYWLETFPDAARTAFFALHHGRLYGKEGSWECLEKDVDVFLANSTWTADQVESVTGIRPIVVRGGINPEHFRPIPAAKEYPILSVGDDRPWKGQETIDEAGTILGLSVERYRGKDLPQADMALEYSKAEVFVVGSHFEGFGQPGLEALACGTPLVTTDNGGCRDYAIDGETALLVSPGDAAEMATAIARLRSDPELAARLSRNGLDLVGRLFDWEAAAADLERVIEGVVAGEISHRRGHGQVLRPPEPSPEISIIVLAWNQLALTERCVTSLRLSTDVPYELILVDNGSSGAARIYAGQAGDVNVLNDTNLGFAKGMNVGLEIARGRFVAFVNNDTYFRGDWASTLVGTLESRRTAGIVAPAVTAAANPINVRSEPGDRVFSVRPFSAPPGAVVWMMPTATARELGGFDESYDIASGEDVDLAFTVWTNGLDVVVDERVLVGHISKGTASLLPDWRALWKRNRDQFLAKWTDPESPSPRLAGLAAEEWRRNRSSAAGAAWWMEQYFRVREQLEEVGNDRQVADSAALHRSKQALEKSEARYRRLVNRRSVRAALAIGSVFERPIRLLRSLKGQR
jgi:glycosyltransferase involved in cell wall biosynthesis/GT2 family glycosyltransferase